MALQPKGYISRVGIVNCEGQQLSATSLQSMDLIKIILQAVYIVSFVSNFPLKRDHRMSSP